MAVSDARLYLETIQHGAAPDAREILLDMRKVVLNDGVPAVENRAFLGRVVNMLSRAGVRQFLELGSGYPAWGNVHSTTARFGDDWAVVYVDHNPDVVAAWKAETDDPRVLPLLADITDPETVLGSPEVRTVLDFARPVAVLLAGVLHLVPDTAAPADLVASYTADLAPGSHLALTHITGDDQPDQTEAVKAVVARHGIDVRFRTVEQIKAMFAGLDLLEPGVVRAPAWRPPAPSRVPPTGWVYGGVAQVARGVTRLPS